MIQDLGLLSKALSPYDVGDTLAKIAGLHLLPGNASHAIRLEALSFAATCNSHVHGLPNISYKHLRNLLNQHLGSRCPLSSQEGPCENMYTEEFTFYRGSYIVFPGITESPTFILRNLCKGLFLSPEPFLKGTPRDSMSLLIIGVLVLSDEIARRSGLARGLEPGQHTWNENLLVPDSKTWSLLQDAVTFDEQEFRRVLSSHGVSLDALNPLITEAGTLPQGQFDSQTSQLMITPVVRVADRLIVAAPALLLAALLNHISSLAIEHEVTQGLARAFRAALWNTLRNSLDLLDVYQVKPPFDMSAHDDSFQDGLFGLDTDKVLYVQLISDDLRGYDVSQPARPWDLSDLPKHLKTRHDQIIQCLLQDHPSPNDVLWLIVFQTIGRPFYFLLDDPISSYDTLMTMSVADLETVCQLEDGNPLALWKYVKQKHRFREKVEVIATSELDEFQIYQSCHHSYYISDDALPTLVTIASGGTGELRRQAYKRLDRHGVPSYRRGFTTEVTRLYGHEVPIYAPPDVDFSRDQVMLLVEQLPIPIWVTGEEYSEENKRDLGKFYFDLADLISYWLWQFSSSLRPVLEPLKGLTDRILFEIYLTPLGDWCELLTNRSTEPDSSYLQDVSFSINAQEATIILDMKPSVLQQLKRSDNSGEREVMATTLVALRNLLAELGVAPTSKLNDSSISTIIEKHAPLGSKKKVLVVDSRTNPILGDEPAPPFRKVQDADEQQLLDEIAEYLKSLGWPAEPVPMQSRKKLLNDDDVAYLYKRLEQIVATLRPDNLLDWLISYNEAITREVYFRRITTPTRLACFSSEQEMKEKLAKEIPEINQAAMASRFLIEYAAARPPTGLRPISLEVYDFLMALASLIVNWGFVSDLIEYNIADIHLKILPSGRLISDRDSYSIARQHFMREYSIGQIRQASRTFATHWQEIATDEDEQKAAELNEMDDFGQAFASEFGFSDQEFAEMCGQVCAIGHQQDSPTKTMPCKELIQEIMNSTDLSYEKVSSFIHQLSLVPRANFMEPGIEYRKGDIYPWRFNRALSYVRRPLIKASTKRNEFIMWGNRHLLNSMFYLVDLCMSGRLKAKSALMKTFIRKERNRQGREFNDDVYTLISELPNLITKRRIDEFSGAKMVDSQGNLGDIDVLGADPTRGQMLLIECKNLEGARTPQEMKNELSRLFLNEEGEYSEVAKVQRRCRWVENNLELVTRELGASQITQWKVTPIIVVSQELMTAYIQSSPVTVLSLRQLTEEFLPKWGNP